ncbi:RSP_2648 family PIN domain-containing protein [Frigidibacter sp. MR17.24]|uniref:RSP_2648 family PIN domain-containing protein n=1 Tax=Frigidibacter sp. MR17.24 TaxID=3127345 RepID=UPI00301315EA
MAVLLDACVLYPTVLREILVGLAREGLFAPLWSERILEEWARAARRFSPADELIARGEIATLRAAFPAASVPVPEAAAEALDLPDPNDRHVLAAAIAGRATAIVTFNLRDFPGWALGPHAIRAEHPDPFLLGLLARDPARVERVVEGVRATAERLSGERQEIRALMKRAKCPRLGKALARG